MFAASPKNWARFFQSTAALIDQPEVGLVHQRGRLECVIGSFSAHVGSRQPSKFVVNQGQNLIQRIVIPVSDIDQQLCQALGIRILHAGILPEYQGIHSSWDSYSP
jgi:hypothetical protein